MGRNHPGRNHPGWTRNQGETTRILIFFPFMNMKALAVCQDNNWGHIYATIELKSRTYSTEDFIVILH